jgi:hypothetical protein
MDTAFPRDKIVIDPCFRIQSAITDVDALCEDLASNLDSWVSGGVPLRELRVRGYDIEGSKPVYPQGDAIRNAGQFAPSSAPRQIAVCLSFYADFNRPRRRGRLYVPYVLMSGSGASGAVVSSTNRAKVSDLVGIFSNLGGVDVDWIVWSEKDKAAHKVTNWFVDDGWDVVRSRRLRSTTRTTGTTSG